MTTSLKSATRAPVRTSVVRINPRFPEATARRLREASAIRGQSVAAFILETVSREAERVLEEETHWKLSMEESAKIQRLLAKPPAINAAAKKAAKDLAKNTVSGGSRIVRSGYFCRTPRSAEAFD